MTPDLAFAMALADAADAITMQHYRSSSLAVRTKSDRTPVSEADEAVETMIRERVAAERPGDGVVGEEFGVSGATSRRWIVDPIDGTKNYIRGVPVWATLIGLEENGRIVAGVVSSPAMGRRWWAAHGHGAFVRALGETSPMHVSNVETLDAAFLTYDAIFDFDARGTSEPFLQLVRNCSRSRGFGDFWIHMMVAEGAVDIAIEPTVAIWDMAPIQLIVEEAGGRFTDLEGNARIDGGSALSTNGRVHDAVLESFR